LTQRPMLEDPYAAKVATRRKSQFFMPQRRKRIK
jgi:hypothetical protein